MIRNSSAPFMQPPPVPPHDPMWLVLDSRAGWRSAEMSHIEDIGACGLRLADVGTAFAFDKLVTAATAPNGWIYKLEKKTIKAFDPCSAEPRIVPGQFPNPRGIGISCGNLFICDAGNHRVAVVSLFGYIPLGFWKPPASAQLANEWEPSSIAFDSRARAYVADPANGAIHRFSAAGRWEKHFSGLGAVQYVAIDCDDRIHFASEPEPDSIQVIDLNGKPLPSVSEPEEWRCRFDCWRIFPDSPPSYQKSGIFRTVPIDSSLYRCQWHRIVLYGDIPVNTRVVVSTFTAETEYTDDFIANLPADSWQTNQVAVQMAKGSWDALILSGPGRFLWLQLQFKGNGPATPRIERIRIEFPRVGPRQYLPAVFAEDPLSSDFTDRFLAVFDTTLRTIEQQLDQQPALYDAAASPTGRGSKDFLTWLATWLGIRLNRQWPEAKRREFVARAAALYRLRGTREGLRRQLLFFIGADPELRCCSDSQPRRRCVPRPLNCAKPDPPVCCWKPPELILEHFKLRRWLFVGKGRLGDQAMVWGGRIINRTRLDRGARVDESQLIMTKDPYRDPFHLYAHKFTVFVPAKFGHCLEYRKSLESLLDDESPAHTVHQIEYVEPRFRIGCQSMVGLDTVVGRYPQGVKVDESRLGSGTVLPKTLPNTIRRIGSTTRLN